MRTDFELKQNYRIDDLLYIMQLLRGEGGCPWDREQNHRSIRNNLIEETYEVVEAIDTDDRALLREELGDLLLQVVFHSQMEKESDSFNFDDVCDGICKKLIHRHPHIFGDIIANNSEEVLKNWDAIKQKEKNQETAASTLEAVSRALPSLVRSCKVQKRAAKAGYCNPDIGGAIDNLKGGLLRLEQAIAADDSKNVSNEMGDLLFSAVNVSRLLNKDPEEVLCFSTDNFIRQFTVAEELAAGQGKKLGDYTAEELDMLCKGSQETR